MRPLNLQTIDWTSGKTLTFEFAPPGLRRTYIAVAHPVSLHNRPIGAIVVAKQKTSVNHSVAQLVKRLALAGALGLVVAALLGWYMSRRIVRPVLALSKAADEVAAGRYDVDVPRRAAGEIGHLADRFGEMAARLAEAETQERNFLMSVSHELRTPLTAIRGHVSALREGVVVDPELAAHSLEVVEAEARRLERLVGDILDLAKLDAHRFTVMREEVDMEQLVGLAYETFAEQARTRSIDYRVDVQPRPVIVSDGDRVLQIVDNLLSNAFRATPDGGRIKLELRRRTARCRSRSRTTARASPTSDESGSSGRSSPAAAAPASAWRSRKSCRERSAAGSSCSRRSGAARASSSCCRRSLSRRSRRRRRRRRSRPPVRSLPCA